mmetsp:Transcript_3663/g.6413  ORF Transcript_3663/g.6413 Transcript_3663/m.6413 type:complete len:555 (-) Transcript_3663:1416-3080(-)
MEKYWDEEDLIKAVAHCDEIEVKRLLDNQTNVNANTSRFGITALQIAASQGHNRIVQMLLAHGANPNLSGKTGRTPLALAAINNRAETISILLEANADINARNVNGYTPLMEVAMGAFPTNETLNLLLYSGANLHVKGDSGITALMCAAYGGSPLKIKSLLAFGAKIDEEDDMDRTPLDIARENEHQKAIKVLQDWPVFFSVLLKCADAGLSGYESLEMLVPVVTNVSEMKIFYSLACFALKRGDITANDRARFVQNLLSRVPKQFIFDKGSEVITTLSCVILPKFEKDGIINSAQHKKLLSECTTADVSMEYKHRSLQEIVEMYLVQEIETLDDEVEDPAIAPKYASVVCSKGCEIAKRYRKYPKISAAAGGVICVLSLFPICGAGLGEALDRIVDFSSIAEISCKTMEFLGGRDKMIQCISVGNKMDEQALEALVQEHNLQKPQVAILGFILLLSTMDDWNELKKLDVTVANDSELCSNASRSFVHRIDGDSSSSTSPPPALKASSSLQSLPNQLVLSLLLFLLLLLIYLRNMFMVLLLLFCLLLVLFLQKK